MICKSDIASLKTEIIERVGQKVIVKGSLGRSRAFEREATLEKAYPGVFIVKYDENNRNESFNYTDVLTRTVEVDTFDGEKFSSLVPPPPPPKRRRSHRHLEDGEMHEESTNELINNEITNETVREVAKVNIPTFTDGVVSEYGTQLQFGNLT